MWTTARNLFHQLTILLGELENEKLSEDLVKALKLDIHYLKNPLTNKPKNASQRSLVGTPGKTVVLGNNQKVTVEDVFSKEAIILSDLFDMNEVDALELILTGELQIRNFNTIPRGLCAVVCYYESHRHFAMVLKILLRLKSVADELMPTILIDFVDELLKDVSVFKKVLAALQTLSVRSEFEKLQKPTVNGLGTAEHQRVLRECILDLQKSYLEILCIFCYHCNKENQIQCLTALFEALRPVKLEQEEGYLTLPNLAIWTALLIFINPLKLRHTENLLEVFTAFKENLYKKWDNPAICSSLAWCFAVAVKCARNLPGGFKNEFEIDESKLVDTALDNCAFQFIRTCILDIPNVLEMELVVDAMDSFLKSFLSYFPEKAQELLNLCEEEILQMNPMDDERKKSRLYYLKFLGIISKLYNSNSSKIKDLCEQFTMPNFMGLENFLKNVRTVSSPRLFIAHLEMLISICKTERVAAHCFKLLQPNGDDILCDWNTLFNGLAKYCMHFQEKRTYDMYQKRNMQTMKLQPSEVSGLITWMKLAATIAEHDPDARQLFYEYHKWNVIDIATNVLIEAFPQVLKGDVYKFLAALATDERASLKIWSMLIGKQICIYEGKQLSGIQIEFELESKNGNYSCTLGFLSLLNKLLSRKNIPPANELTPFIHFITKTVMADFASRQYSDISQLMEMLILCLDSLYQLIRHYFVTQESILGNSVQSYILNEILTDSALNKTLTTIIIECADRLDDYSPKNNLREKMALSALRLLSNALSQRKSYVEAIKSCGSSKMVASHEKLLLSPLYSRKRNNMLAVLLSFVSNSTHLIKHTFFVMKILKDLCVQSNSLQALLVSTMAPHKTILQGIFARLTSPFDEEIVISPVDIPIYDLPDFDNFSIPRLRGEIARQVLEILIASLDSDPNQPNIAYLLCGFDITSIGTSDIVSIDQVGESVTCLQSLTDIVEIFIARNDPFNVSFSALFEPTLRLLLKFISYKNDSSTVMLRFLRLHHSMIRRLFESNNFKFIHVFANAIEHEGTAHLSKFVNIASLECTDPIFRRAIQGIILQMGAIELTSLISNGNYSESHVFFNTLFGQSNVLSDPESPDESFVPNSLKEVPLIWALLENSKADCLTLKSPVLNKFDNQRIDEILDVCLYENSGGVEQYDIQYLQFLLIVEIQSVVTKEIDVIQNECLELLKYCVRYNARRLLEASCVHLLSGWIAMINAISFFTPLNFIDYETQKSYLIDGLFLLLKYTREVSFNNIVLSAISNSVFRLVTAITEIVAVDSNIKNRKIQLSHVVSTLLDCLVIPAYSKCVSFKLDLYGSIMKVFTICNSPKEDNQEDIDLSRNILASILREQRDVESKWGAVFSTLSEEITRTISEDINFAPFQLKIVATSCMIELIREDVKQTQMIAIQFVKLGNIKSILMNLEGLKLDFAYILDAKNKQAAVYIQAILSLLTELSFAGTVWNTLLDYDVIGRISRLTFWQNVPQGFFTGKNWEINFKTAEGSFASLFMSLIELCIGMASNNYWKSVSIPILELVDRFQEFTNQLIRSQPTHQITKNVSMLVYYIHELDETTRDIVMKTKCLKDLYQHHVDGGKKKGFDLINPPTRPAFNLPTSLLFMKK